jgi:hypothetical protein
VRAWQDHNATKLLRQGRLRRPAHSPERILGSAVSERRGGREKNQETDLRCEQNWLWMASPDGTVTQVFKSPTWFTDKKAN